jgi:hypothetical protein
LEPAPKSIASIDFASRALGNELSSITATIGMANGRCPVSSATKSGGMSDKKTPGSEPGVWND